MTYILLDGAEMERDASFLDACAQDMLGLGSRTVACCCTPGLGAAGQVAMSRAEDLHAQLRDVATTVAAWARDLRSRATAIQSDAALPGLAAAVGSSAAVPAASAVGEAASGPGWTAASSGTSVTADGSTLIVIDGDLSIVVPPLDTSVPTYGVAVIGGDASSIDGGFTVSAPAGTAAEPSLGVAVLGGDWSSSSWDDVGLVVPELELMTDQEIGDRMEATFAPYYAADRAVGSQAGLSAQISANTIAMGFHFGATLVGVAGGNLAQATAPYANAFGHQSW